MRFSIEVERIEPLLAHVLVSRGEIEFPFVLEPVVRNHTELASETPILDELVLWRVR